MNPVAKRIRAGATVRLTIDPRHVGTVTRTYAGNVVGVCWEPHGWTEFVPCSDLTLVKPKEKKEHGK